MKKLILVLIFVISLTFLVSNNAEAAFSADWGYSWDSPHVKGYKYVAKWLIDNSYASSIPQAIHFAKKHYIGYESGDSDPFYFDPGDYSAEIVYENSAYINKNLAGYYTETLDVISKFELFTGTDGAGSGSKNFSVSEGFGLYLHSYYLEGTDWFTDRFDNSAQSGVRLPKNHAQALIYELEENSKWLIVWEDLDMTGCHVDRDYNDMYILLTKSTVPEPASLFLFGIGLIGIPLLKRRKQ